MKIVMFCHSLVSDWNHGNAHFLRGIADELIRRGHRLRVLEPVDGWSRTQLLQHHGEEAVHRFHEEYPALSPEMYDLTDFDPEPVIAGADVVIVHEWNPPELVARIGELKRRHGFVLLFHDTHHRMATDAEAMGRYDLSNYDGVLAFGEVLRKKYLSTGLARRAWTWHEAADTRRFHPMPQVAPEADVVWIGNWGDDERTAEIHEFLIDPVRELGLSACVYGVRYPDEARRELERAGIEYRGWLPNHQVPAVFARFRVTVHIPRQAYAGALPGIPTIRPFEAMACGIPLVSAPWDDVEGLFDPGSDFLVARNGHRMKAHLAALLENAEKRKALAARGLATIGGRHTCAHRVDELLEIVEGLRAKPRARANREPLLEA